VSKPPHSLKILWFVVKIDGRIIRQISHECNVSEAKIVEKCALLGYYAASSGNL
jgi:hypothetical protein